MKNKFQRPSQLIAPIDPVDYFREVSLASGAIDTSNVHRMQETRSKGVLLKNNQTE